METAHAGRGAGPRRERGRRVHRLPVLRPARADAALLVPAHELTEDIFEEGSGFDGSSIRGFQEIQESDMLLVPDPDTAAIDPFRARTRPSTSTASSTTRSPASPTPATPATSPRRPRTTWCRPGIADTAYFGPEPSSSSSTTSASTRQPHQLLRHRLDRGHLEHRQADEGAQPRLQAPPQAGLLPGPAHGPLPGPPLGDDPDHGAARHRDRDPAPRGRHRRPGRDRHALRHAGGHGRQADALQVRGQERGPGRRA